MKLLTWLVLIAIAAMFGYALWRGKRHWDERKRAENERLASFMAQALPAGQGLAATQIPSAAQAMPQASDANALPQQKLLFESAAKAAQAGEPGLSIQLYARLLSRYPDSSLAGLARTAIDEHKKKLATP